MKSLPNSTNGVIVLSDSFATSIFKQSFLRIFVKDDQGHLQMGFNATFDVQVRKSRVSRFVLSLTLGIDNKGAQSIWSHRTCHISREKVSLCRGNGDWYRSDVCLEDQHNHSSDIDGRILRSCHSCGSTPPARFPGTYTVRHSLPALIRPAASTCHDHCT